MANSRKNGESNAVAAFVAAGRPVGRQSGRTVTHGLVSLQGADHGCAASTASALQLRNKSPKRRVKTKLRDDRVPATAANQAWAMDFVHDQLFDGRKIRALTVVDIFTKLSPVIEVRQAWRGSNVVSVLNRTALEVGCPRTIRLDNGPEFISKDLDLWAFMHDVTLDFSRPGKPTDNAFIESFNGKFRGECLNTNWFLSLDEAARKCEAWRRDYNEVRPHSAIGNQVPAVLHRTAGKPGQRPADEAESSQPRWSKVGGRLRGQPSQVKTGPIKQGRSRPHMGHLGWDISGRLNFFNLIPESIENSL